MDKQDARHLRELRILRQIAGARRPPTLSELAARVGAAKSSVTRVLHALLAGGFVTRAALGRGFVIGPNGADLALAILGESNLTTSIRSSLGRLVAATGESCNLNVLDGDSMRYVARVTTNHPLALQMPVGSRVPLYCTATGKLALGLMDEERRARILDRVKLIALTPRTLKTTESLKKECLQIASQHFATENEEFVRGMVAIAVPVKSDSKQTIMAISVHALTARMTLTDLRRHLPALRAAAAEISLIVGSRHM